MAQVRVEQVTKMYGQTEAVHGISFQVDDGELVVILGPSGCGKTTTLRMIAGLESITSGRILFDDVSVGAIAPAQRNVAMAFENYGLYEHWSVFDNIAYPLKLRGNSAQAIERKVSSIAESLQIADVLQARPRRLSGGMRQRIGLARALVREPAVFLLDEPMSHVDADLRNDMRAEIERIHLATGSTMIIVSHDQLDALALAHRVLVMNGGVIEQYDTPEEVYDSPISTFVAGFVGEPPMNVIPMGADSGQGETLLGFRPHRVRVSTERPAHQGSLVLAGRVYMVEWLGDRTLVTVSHQGRLLKADLPRTVELRLDQDVWLEVDNEDILLFDAESGRRTTLKPRFEVPGA